MTNVDNKNNYMVFIGMGCGKGGWNDFFCFCETLEQAYSVSLSPKLLYDWIHIVNSKNGEIIYKKIRARHQMPIINSEHNLNKEFLYSKI